MLICIPNNKCFTLKTTQISEPPKQIKIHYLNNIPVTISNPNLKSNECSSEEDHRTHRLNLSNRLENSVPGTKTNPLYSFDHRTIKHPPHSIHTETKRVPYYSTDPKARRACNASIVSAVFAENPKRHDGKAFGRSKSKSNVFPR